MRSPRVSDAGRSAGPASPSPGASPVLSGRSRKEARSMRAGPLMSLAQLLPAGTLPLPVLGVVAVVAAAAACRGTGLRTLLSVLLRSAHRAKPGRAATRAERVAPLARGLPQSARRPRRPPGPAVGRPPDAASGRAGRMPSVGQLGTATWPVTPPGSASGLPLPPVVPSWNNIIIL